MSEQYVLVEPVAQTGDDVERDEDGEVVNVSVPVVAGPFDHVDNADMEAHDSPYVVVAIPSDSE